ncbi:MAG TPA: hypothetical protein DC047_07285 [Blastocatellia bacterium]|nr:hypothetical protein [Blastocatellia bacterium]
MAAVVLISKIERAVGRNSQRWITRAGIAVAGRTWHPAYLPRRAVVLGKNNCLLAVVVIGQITAAASVWNVDCTVGCHLDVAMKSGAIAYRINRHCWSKGSTAVCAQGAVGIGDVLRAIPHTVLVFRKIGISSKRRRQWATTDCLMVHTGVDS